MPFYKLALSRRVSRLIELNQTSTLFVQASSLIVACQAAQREAAHGVLGWTDGVESADSEDKVIREPTVVSGSPITSPPKGEAVLCAEGFFDDDDERSESGGSRNKGESDAAG